MRRLEEEQTEFHEYLERLRRAKDKAEFDSFMAEQAAKPKAGEDDDGPIIDEDGNDMPENRPNA